MSVAPPVLVTSVLLALLVVAVSEAVFWAELVLLVPPALAELVAAVIATAVVPVLPKPVAVVAENPPVPSVVLASDVVAVALVGWAVLPLVSRVALAFVPESEAQELTQPAQPRHQKSV